MKSPQLLERRDPHTFLLWLGISSIVLLFLVLSVIYLNHRVRSGGSVPWISFQFPKVFWLSTLLILMSSYTLHRAGKALKIDQFSNYRSFLATTGWLGGGFIVLQIIGWRAIFAEGASLQNSPSAAFLYVISGLHIAHILGGLVFLGIMMTEAIRHKQYIDAFIDNVNPAKQLRFKLFSIYWHFIDGLWLYLFFFFLFQHLY